MGRWFGCWSWNEAGTVLVRDDGAFLKYLGTADQEFDFRGGHWFRFLIGCTQGQSPLLVQHRPIGFQSQYRDLYWRADFTRGPSPTCYAQWAAFEQIAADGLACWPMQIFGEIPDFVAVEGGWSDGRFVRDRYHIYERARVQRLFLSGRVLEPDAVERHWSFRPLDAAVSAPSRAALAKSASSRAVKQGLAAMIDRGPALTCEDRAILLEEDENGALQATYVDEDFVSDRYRITGRYRGQEDRWYVGDYASVELGARRLDNLRPASLEFPKGLLGLLWKEPKRDHRGGENWDADPVLVERAAESFAEALFEVPSGAFTERRVFAPPKLVELNRGWIQAGYLKSRSWAARTLPTDEFVAAFADAPPPALVTVARSGINFDRELARLVGPNGSSLTFERLLDADTDGASVLLRCAGGGLDWPVVVRQGRHRYQELRPWRIDHHACLGLWRAETGRDLPQPAHWDCMRQFIEDAILSWADCEQTGPAPQRLVTSGGFYDGLWRTAELARTVDRPLHYDETVREPDTGEWSDYAPVKQWRRTDDLPVDLGERHYHEPNYVYGGGGRDEAPIPFEKARLSDAARLAASVLSISFHREEAHRADYADFVEGEKRLRVEALRSTLALGRVWPLGADAPSHGEWNPTKAAAIRPDLATWRGLRDAAESGLRAGETVTVTGVWLFDRFFGSFAERRTELSG